MADYVLGIDQSTQGTKALLFDENGRMLGRADLPHRQMINERGWVEHDPEEIYRNVIETVKMVVKQTGIDPDGIRTVGISNQRETALAWERRTGKPVYPAIVWQCARGADICRELERHGMAEEVRRKTGLALSPYFSAAKLAWLMQNVPEAKMLAEKGELCCGTVDSYLVYRLTHGGAFRTDYSNASRTQLFHIEKLRWDETLCQAFGISTGSLPELTDSDGNFGMTDFEGYLRRPIPIRAVLGDSHGALFGQGCLERGMLKATYGTGSSVMMNIGEKPVFSKAVVTSLAWKLNGVVTYVLEGNINYTGAVISWLKDDLGLLDTPAQAEQLARAANPKDTTYLIPAFSGLGAPHWNSEAKAAIFGMSRTTRKAELVKAGLESIAYQIQDVLEAMQQESGILIRELRADGGATRNAYLMQFQSDLAQACVCVPKEEELSGIGAAYVAGIAEGIYQQEALFLKRDVQNFTPKMTENERNRRYDGWKDALRRVIMKEQQKSMEDGTNEL